MDAHLEVLPRILVLERTLDDREAMLLGRQRDRTRQFGLRALHRADMDGIVDIQLARLQKRLMGRKITLAFDDAAKTWLADEGYDPVFGARPLKRVIQRALQDPLAELLLSGDVKDGDTVVVSAGAEGLIIGDRIGATNRERPGDAVVH